MSEQAPNSSTEKRNKKGNTSEEAVTPGGRGGGDQLSQPTYEIKEEKKGEAKIEAGGINTRLLVY